LRVAGVARVWHVGPQQKRNIVRQHSSMAAPESHLLAVYAVSAVDLPLPLFPMRSKHEVLSALG